MANSTSIPEIMGPGFFIFFQVDSPGSGGQIRPPRHSESLTTPQDIIDENDEAAALALLLLSCD